jgi:hypothetical protein
MRQLAGEADGQLNVLAEVAGHRFGEPNVGEMD